MKMYSNEVASASEIQAIRQIADDATTMVTVVDAKQNRQIQNLRIWLAVSFAVNAAFTLALYFVK